MAIIQEQGIDSRADTKSCSFHATLIKFMCPLFCLVLGCKHTITLPAVRIAAASIPSLELLFLLNTLLNIPPWEGLLGMKENEQTKASLPVTFRCTQSSLTVTVSHPLTVSNYSTLVWLDPRVILLSHWLKTVEVHYTEIDLLLLKCWDIKTQGKEEVIFLLTATNLKTLIVIHC